VLKKSVRDPVPGLSLLFVFLQVIVVGQFLRQKIKMDHEPPAPWPAIQQNRQAHRTDSGRREGGRATEAKGWICFFTTAGFAGDSFRSALNEWLRNSVK
jgi:hypothetical protein